MSKENIEHLHNEAMNLADEADLLKSRGQIKESLELYGKAFFMEREAALAAISSGVEELSVNILVKSAAFLGNDAGLIRESEQMVGLALSRNLPEEIAEEMRDLLENLYFARHLRLNGITLSDNEVQIVVAGCGVAHGMAREDDVNDRIGTFKQMVVRTAERSKGKNFRTSGQPAKEIRDMCMSYVSVPRAASFAVTVRIGGASAPTLSNFQGEANALIEDVVTNLAIVNSGDIPALRQRIENHSYLENFVNLAKEFAPDGDRVNLVGLTYNKAGKEFPIELTRPKMEYQEVVNSIVRENLVVESMESFPEGEQIVGTLYSANSNLDEVRLRTNDNRNIKIKVSEGLADVVRKYFDAEVIANVSRDESRAYRLLSVDLKDDGAQIF